MEASLDTNVIIHLYKANYQDLLFKRFKKLKVYSLYRNEKSCFNGNHRFV